MYTQFVPMESWQVAKDKPARLNQRTSVATYNKEFMNRMLSIPEMTEQDRVDKYVRGLKLGPKKEVMICRCKTLEDAMATADRADAVFYSIQSWNRPGNTATTGNSDGPTPMEISQVRNAFQEIVLHVELGDIVASSVHRGQEAKDGVKGAVVDKLVQVRQSWTWSAAARKSFTFEDRVRYIRHELLQRRHDNLPTGLDWKLDCYNRLGLLAAWDKNKHGDEVKRHRLVDNKTLEYCVAKVSDSVWVYVDEIFVKYEQKRLPEQIAAAAALQAKQARAKRRSKKPSKEREAAVVVETKERGIPVRVWRGFQGIEQSAAGQV